MIRFTKESEYERIERLEKMIVDDYFENENSNELMISEADLLFLLEKAGERLKIQYDEEEEEESQILADQENELEEIDGKTLFDEEGGYGGQVF